MLLEIHLETQHPDHSDYGMFILVIMSHGTSDGSIYGTDGRTIKLVEILDLLSSDKMAGKPKLVIIEACGGGNMSQVAILTLYTTSDCITPNKY